jgi:mannose-6-phosphate isomerase-like protein (cupin superfamily)
MYHDLDASIKQVITNEGNITLQMINEEYLRLQYFTGEADWHTEDRDEFFIVMEGEVFFSVEDQDYSLKKGDLLVVESGKRHRANSLGCVLFSVEPHS